MKIIRKKIIRVFLVTRDETEGLVPVLCELSITIKIKERETNIVKRLFTIKQK